MSDISKLGKSNINLPSSADMQLKQDFKLNDAKKGEVSKEKLKEVADMYEKHFIKEMMKQMTEQLKNKHH